MKNLYRNLAKAIGLNLVMREMYSFSNGKRVNISLNLEEEFRAKFDPVIEEFHSHKALNHQLFSFLKESAREGFTSKQYEIYRDNFFRRTELTMPYVAKAIEKAALNDDPQAVADMVRNLNDEVGFDKETGSVNQEKMHSSLLLKSHNFHGMRVFNINPIQPISEASKSPNLVLGVEEYRKAKQAAFERSYPYISGNIWAHELAADDMLDNFRKAFFEPYEGYYKAEEYQELTEFFSAHKDDSIENGDVEAQHERMAKSAAERACKKAIENIREVREGGLIFLDHQAKLWDDLLMAIERAQLIGSKIEPKFVEETNIPKPSTQPKNTKNLQGKKLKDIEI